MSSSVVLGNGAVGLGGLGEGLALLFLWGVGGIVLVPALIALGINLTAGRRHVRHLRAGAVFAGLPAFGFGLLGLLVSAVDHDASTGTVLFLFAVSAIGLGCLLTVLRGGASAAASKETPVSSGPAA